MEKQLKQFYKFLEVDKKASSNTLQSYKRDLKQFSEYIEEKGIKYNKVTENDIKEYLEYLAKEEEKKPSTISRTIASIRAFYQYEVKNKKTIFWRVFLIFINNFVKKSEKIFQNSNFFKKNQIFNVSLIFRGYDIDTILQEM